MKKYLPLIFFISIISACSSSKNISYFQDIENTQAGLISEKEIAHSLMIRADDELSILVSSTDPTAAAAFNLPLAPLSSSSISGVKKPGENSKKGQMPTSQIQSYLVDSSGDINFPVLGKIRIAGMSRDEAVVYLTKRLEEYISEPIVNLQIINFKISILGEVTTPGSYSYTNQRVSVLDAIASAQDLTIHGQRDNIIIIRDNNGKKEYAKFDLTSTNIIESPYFYLQQNDVIYVTPNKTKQQDALSGLEKQSRTSLIMSSIGYVVSIAAILVTAFK